MDHRSGERGARKAPGPPVSAEEFMGGNHMSRDWRYIDKTKVHCPFPTTGGSKQHLNATLPPTHANAPTKYGYLSTDGSDTAPYLKA